MQSQKFQAVVDSPVGRLLIVSDGVAITGLYMPPRADRGADCPLRGCEALRAAQDQLEQYFAGQLTEFDLPLAPEGTEFQQRVWRELRTIGYGETATYLELARRLGQPSASRAVGGANARNPISIIVPCHRVIGASGGLTGYAGGLERKQWLLAHERSVIGSRIPQEKIPPQAKQWAMVGF